MNLLKGRLTPLLCHLSNAWFFCEVMCSPLTPLAHRHVSEYLTVQPKDPKAHKFLGQLFERDGETDKAVGCHKVGILHLL